MLSNCDQDGHHYHHLICLSLALPTSSDPDIVNGVYWSEALNKVFVDNFERDPTLTWQYFGSAKGFFRQYPGECCHTVSLTVLTFFVHVWVADCGCVWEKKGLSHGRHQP